MSERVDELIERGETRELGIFVPAIMSAGLVFSLVALVQDGLNRRRWTAQNRRTAVAALALADLVRTGVEPGRDVVRPWLRSRAAYAALGPAATVGAVLLGIGATENYLRDDGYVAGIAWLWALSILVSVALLVGGLAAVAIVVRWPRPPVWVLPFLVRTPLARRPTALDERAPATRAAIAAAWAAVMLVLLAGIVTELPSVVSGSDIRFADAIAGWSLPPVLDVAWFGRVEVVLAFAIVALILGHRCTVFSVAYLVAVTFVFLFGFLVQAAVQRDRPLGVWLTGITTFPSVPLAQAVVIAALVPVAVRISTHRRRFVVPTALALGAGAVVTAVVLVHERYIWPTDVVGGVLSGLTTTFVVAWALAHRRWHAPCDDCPWSHEEEEATGRVGLIVLSHEWTVGLKRGAITLTLVVVGILVFLALRFGIPQDPEGGMVGSQLAQPLQVALLALMAIGAFVAFRWAEAGAIVVALGGIGLAVLSATEYPPAVALAVAATALAPGFMLWLAWQRLASGRRIWYVALIATLALTGGYLGASAIYAHFFGPTHPASALPLQRVSRTQWAWSGAVEPTRATIVGRVVHDAGHAHVELTPVDGGDAVSSPRVSVPGNRIVHLTADGLRPGTRYEWRVVVDGGRDTSRGRGRLSTPTGGAQSFTIVAGACARSGSNGRVWEAMRRENPDLTVLLGDLFYENIERNDVDTFLAAYDRVLTQPAVAALVQDAPVAYVWDDHDYGPNDGDASSPSREAARDAYRAAVPHSKLAPAGPVAQAFTVGRVRFVMTDARSNRTATSMLGEEQTEWFLDELVASSRTHALVVWVNSVPWIGRADPGSDSWSGYPKDRARIAEVIDGAGIRNLVMLAGDAHMVAIDDGSNSGYAESGGGGFPLLHAAALDRPGSVKGGPYSEGAHPGGGQYGVLRIDDDGTTVTVHLAGKTWKGKTLVSYRFTVPGGPPA